jgi:hypothetical protein
MAGLASRSELCWQLVASFVLEGWTSSMRVIFRYIQQSLNNRQWPRMTPGRSAGVVDVHMRAPCSRSSRLTLIALMP